MSNSSFLFSEPCTLTLTLEAFKLLSDEKQRLLASLKERYIINAVINDTRSEVTWYLTNENFLKLTEEHPWLLDKDLGESK